MTEAWQRGAAAVVSACAEMRPTATPGVGARSGSVLPAPKLAGQGGRFRVPGPGARPPPPPPGAGAAVALIRPRQNRPETLTHQSVIKTTFLLYETGSVL